MQSLNRLVAGVRWATTLLFVIVVYASPARAVTETVLYAFTGLDGSYPSGGLVIDAAGNLYGTTEFGGTFGNGSVFELTPSGGVWTEKVLYSFIGPSDGENPIGGLVFDLAGNLYGTAFNGGDPESQGTVFELSPSGGGWTEKTIYTFGSNPTGDGCNPAAGLTLDSVGNLYGTTFACGGGVSTGTVFELSPSGGGWSETILWKLDGFPEAGVVFDQAGNLYGTTTGGGHFGKGSVFRLTQVSGTWTGTSIFSFTGGNNGCDPYGGVIVDKVGNLYGTTMECGADEVGTIFKLTPTQGQWTMSVLHTFTGGIDGAVSTAGLEFDSVGNLYGTTQSGGLFGNGTVFRLTPKKNGTWAEAEYSFMGGSSDGAGPLAGLLLGTISGTGAVLGTTGGGGASGLGTVFEITAK